MLWTWGSERPLTFERPSLTSSRALRPGTSRRALTADLTTSIERNAIQSSTLSNALPSYRSPCCRPKKARCTVACCSDQRFIVSARVQGVRFMASIAARFALRSVVRVRVSVWVSRVVAKPLEVVTISTRSFGSKRSTVCRSERTVRS